ncbi:MAG TPA: GntR family transcriptional regulator [Burkholderiaceae bacterium]|jgi:DNA-binding GntR family transcriptional regulator|nr:GntR family transcriptional regulator [Burkholderiaceae bacterium]
MDLALSRPEAVRGDSLQERIRHSLEAEILSGVRPPGSPIDEKALARDFSASRTPVREALLTLSARGLVQIVPRSGIHVRKASTAELVATLEALVELESVLARLAARRASPEQCKAMRKALARAGARALANDRKGYEAANAVLHEQIYHCAANPVLVEQARQVRGRLSAYRKRGFDQPGRLAVSDREHAAIVSAICEGHDAEAAEAMRLHISVGGEAMMALVLASEAARPGGI